MKHLLLLLAFILFYSCGLKPEKGKKATFVALVSIQFDEAVQDSCSIVFKKNGVALKQFDAITTSVNRSSKNNLKFTNNLGTSISIIYPADITAMGFANEAAFTSFYNSIRQSCLGIIGPLPVFANNAGAITGGLVLHALYRTSTGQVMIRF